MWTEATSRPFSRVRHLTGILDPCPRTRVPCVSASFRCVAPDERWRLDRDRSVPGGRCPLGFTRQAAGPFG